ncbi:MAG: hypothetical protein D6741_19720 [Planctomycetota bacterium]|nr:MAG: hypothetical protein D6741_19720 [Planctomycetota bacterium]
MQNLADDIAAKLKITSEAGTIDVYIFANQADYKDFVGRRFPDVPYRRALFVLENGRSMVFTARGRDFETDLRHECTHALLHAALPMVPLWLDEGLAEYFEVPPGNRAFGSPYLKTIRWACRFRRVPDLGRLESLGSMQAMGEREYREAWSWVHFMLHGPPPAQEELIAFLKRIHDYTPPGSLKAHLSQRIPDLRRAYIDHFLTWHE